MIATLLQIATMFALLSLLAFGGGAAVLPDMQRQAVEVHHWVTSREFLDMFALSRAIPPGSMIVVLIGQRVAGILGGLVALLAIRTVLPVGLRRGAAVAPRRRGRLAGDVGAGAGTGVDRRHHRQRHRPRPQHGARLGNLCRDRRHHIAAGAHAPAPADSHGTRRCVPHSRGWVMEHKGQRTVQRRGQADLQAAQEEHHGHQSDQFLRSPDRDRNGVQCRGLLFNETYRAGVSGGGWMTAVWQRDH